MKQKQKLTPRRATRRVVARHPQPPASARSLPAPTPAPPAEIALHKRRLQWFGLLAAGLLLIQLAYNLQANGTVQALGQAASITHSSLLSAANGQRQANGLQPLRLNPQLSEAAQAKAQDMITKDYWSHQAPDGAEPWHFIRDARYHYQTAGENLAYGFKTGDATVAAWMQSRTHRANLLGQYRDVGFGYASGAHFQNGKNTVVVAFFGTPAKAGQQPQVEFATESGFNTEAHRVLGASVVSSGTAPWGTYASLGMLGAVSIGFVITHLELMRLSWQRARRFAALHPLIDAIVLAVLMVLVVQAVGGFIG